MRLFNVKGRLVSKNVRPYLIKWEGKSRSNIQYQVKRFLKPFWAAHVVYEEFPVYGTLMTVDLLNASYKIAIEVQGPQHTSFHYFHGGEPINYLDSIKRDVLKNEWLEKNGFHLIEINYDEIDRLSCQFFQEKFNLTL